MSCKSCSNTIKAKCDEIGCLASIADARKVVAYDIKNPDPPAARNPATDNDSTTDKG